MARGCGGVATATDEHHGNASCSGIGDVDIRLLYDTMAIQFQYMSLQCMSGASFKPHAAADYWERQATQ